MRALVFILLLAAAVLAQMPRPAGFVNDFAGVINDSSEYSITAALDSLEKDTGAEIAVVTVDALPQDETMQSYANRLLNEWGVGKKGEDNGLLILVAVQERRIQVETGYGLEGILPDGRVGRILDDHIDELSTGDYSVGLEGIVNDIADVVRNEYVPGAKPQQSFAVQVLPYVIISFVVLLIIGAIAYTKFAGKCPKCRSRLRKETVSRTSKEMKIKIYCLQCGYVKYVTKKTRYGMIIAGSGGGRGGGFGGFGGGGSGGGGAGRGF